VKQKEGNCKNTRGDTLSRAFKRMLYLERSTPWAMSPASLDVVCVSMLLPCGYVLALQLALWHCADLLWLCVGIATCFVALNF
jgi:hypothetical protein